MNKKLQPAIVGGVVLGLLSGIPYVNLGNILCCLWIVSGGALATYLYIKRSASAVSVGEGALLGAGAGLIGTLVHLLVGVPLTILTGYPELNLLINFVERVDPQKAEAYRQRVEELMAMPFAAQFLRSAFSTGTLLSLLVTVIFALIGGLVAVPLFEKRKTDEGLAQEVISNQ